MISALLKKTNDVLITYANSKYALLVLAIVAFTESSFFIIPPDIFLFIMAMAIPQKALLYALVTTIFSILGGVFGYFLGFVFFDAFIYDFLVNREYISAFYAFRDLYNTHSTFAILIAGFTPIPYKIATIASGVFETNLIQFIGASTISRGLRFFLLAYLIQIFNKKGKDIVLRHFKLLVGIFSTLLIIAFIVYTLFT